MGRRLTDNEILAQIPATRVREKAVRAAGIRAKSVAYDARSRRFMLELSGEDDRQGK